MSEKPKLSSKDTPKPTVSSPPPAVEEHDEKSEGGSEYEEIDLTENPLYQVLSAFFENEEGENLCDHIAKLTSAVEKNTKMMSDFLKKCPSSSSSSSKK